MKKPLLRRVARPRLGVKKRLKYVTRVGNLSRASNNLSARERAPCAGEPMLAINHPYTCAYPWISRKTAAKVRRGVWGKRPDAGFVCDDGVLCQLDFRGSSFRVIFREFHFNEHRNSFTF